MRLSRLHESPCGLPWRILEHHYGSRNNFLAIYETYERRVARHVHASGVGRETIKLGPAETRDLFDTWRLKELIDHWVRPLRDASHAYFRDKDVTELYDTKVSRIYHELSILKEEHLSVREFPHELAGAREFARLFREVSKFYPQRLLRVRELFERAEHRIEELLPGFAADQIVLRSAYLFREDLWPRDAQAGLNRFFDKMFPEYGAAYGLLQVARSFLKAGFYGNATASARMGVAAGGRQAQARTSRAQEVRETLAELDRLIARADAEYRAIQEQAR